MDQGGRGIRNVHILLFLQPPDREFVPDEYYSALPVLPTDPFHQGGRRRLVADLEHPRVHSFFVAIYQNPNEYMPFFK